MPKPNKTESKQDFLKRCTGELVEVEGRETDQAYAMCNNIWNDEHSQRAALQLTAPVELAGEDDPEKKAGFLITAYTGAIIDRGWYGKLAILTEGIRTKNKLPILREHRRDRVVGYGVKAWKDGASLFIRGEYSQKTRDGREVRDLGDEGFPWEASIGVWPKKVKMLESDKESATVNGQEISGPMEIWTESEVREVSFVALGADDRTAAINFSEEATVRVSIERGQPQEKQEDGIMLTLKQLEAEAPELLQEIREAARGEGMLAGRDEGAAAERTRVLEILEADGDLEVSLKAIKEGTAAAETFKLLYQAERGKRRDMLTKLEEEAPASMGQAPPKPPETTAENPDQKLAKLAQDLAREKKISLDEAMLQVAQEHPELVAKWNPGTGLH